MNFLKQFRFLIISLFLLIGIGQHTLAMQGNKAQKQFQKALISVQQKEYLMAQKQVLLAIKSDSIYVNAYLLLSDIAAELKNDVQFQWALQKVIEIVPSKYPQAYKLLANNYFINGKYAQALQLYTACQQLNLLTDSVYLNTQIRKCQYANELITKKLNIEIEHLETYINTGENEYWPMVSADDSVLYFTRLITREKPYAFERLYYSKKTLEGWTAADEYIIGNNNEVNEGTLSMVADGHLVFFTACGRPDGMGSCDIYYLVHKNGQWLSPQNAGQKINTAKWDAQPSVSSKGDALFWSSNRDGGFGGKDIWTASIFKNVDGSIQFGEPENLGNVVNSKQHDFSPFIHADDHTLYFASDGHMGLGKSDMFMTRFCDSVWINVQNLGFPINSISDDDGLVVSPTAHVALFSSNRPGSFENSKDLYFFKLPEEFRPIKTGFLKGAVFDALSRQKIDATIELSNLSSAKNWTIDVNKNTGYMVTLASHQDYAFNINKKGYLMYSDHFSVDSSHNYSEAAIYNIYLQPIQLNATIELKNIFFEFDSYKLNDNSRAELEQLQFFLKQNPRVKVEISGHTDNLGNADYNLRLSEERAKAILTYLEKYIDTNRMSYRGYGHQIPIATNETEAGRAKNRRSELQIIAY